MAVDRAQSRVRADAGERGLLLSRPGAMLRVEGAALLLLVPDVSMLGYLAGSWIGAATYNVFHSYTLPVALGVFGLLAGSQLAVGLALVWISHIGLDRMLRYGLKYPTEFKDTHLERL